MTISSVEQPTLSQLLRDAMERQGFSNNRLAKTIGVSESTIRSFFLDETEPRYAKPQAPLLRAICQILQLDEIRTFQAAGFLSLDWTMTDYSPAAENLAYRFDRLPQDKQALLLKMLDSLEQASGIPSAAEEISQVLDAVRALQRQYPVYRHRRLVLTDRMGRFVGGMLGRLVDQSVEDICAVDVVERVNAQLTPNASLSRQDIERIVNHPKVEIALNALLPSTKFPSNIEKLYWLIYPNRNYMESLDAQTLEAVQTLWNLLLKLSRS